MAAWLMPDDADPSSVRFARRVRLEPIDSTNWRRALEVTVEEGQLRFVALHQPVAYVVPAKSYVRPEGLDWRPYMVVHGDRCAGVLALAFSAEACGLFHFAIDAAHQRQGYGTSTMEAVVNVATQHHPDCREISLTVHPENAAARVVSRQRLRPIR